MSEGTEKIIFPGAPRRIGKRVLMSEDTEYVFTRDKGHLPPPPNDWTYDEPPALKSSAPEYLWRSVGTPQEVECIEEVSRLRQVWHRIKEWFGYPPYEPLRWMETRIVWSTPEQVR